MKSKLISAVIVSMFVLTAPAHAISAKHRKALEWSGCTMANEGTTCNIKKPAEWNRKQMAKNGTAQAEAEQAEKDAAYWRSVAEAEKKGKHF